ncbi:hypothetical protein CHUAL_003253 [Chamberlinius hualienensis]
MTKQSSVKMYLLKILLLTVWLLVAFTSCEDEEMKIKEADKTEEVPKLDTTNPDTKGTENKMNDQLDNEQQKLTNSTTKLNKTDSEVNNENDDEYICHMCNCPYRKQENPYMIDCRSLHLDAIPRWDQSLNDVDNIHLDLSSNNFNLIPPFPYNSYIDALYFNFNNVDSVTANAFSQLPHLKTLHLFENKISDIHRSAFCGQNDTNSHLEVLDLTKNYLNRLDDDLFQCTPNLRHLILAENKLLSIDLTTQTAFNSLRYLELLDLSKNGLSQLPMGLINPICYLTNLNLAFNTFQQVPEVLQGAVKLKYLNLDQNPIENFDHLSFVGLTNLKNLSISRMMSLTTIKTGAFQYLHNLRAVNCNENHNLTTIEQSLFGGSVGHGSTHLDLFELQNNSLAHLNESVFNETHIHVMDLRGNPLVCSCGVFWIVAKASYYGTTQYMNETICRAPVKFNGTSIDKVMFQGEELHCPDIQLTVEPPKMPRAYTFLLVLVVISTFLILFFIGYIAIHKLKFVRYQTLHIPGSSNGQFKASKFNDAFDVNGEEMEVYSK